MPMMATTIMSSTSVNAFLLDLNILFVSPRWSRTSPPVGLFQWPVK
jgi:hypothetical protein